MPRTARIDIRVVVYHLIARESNGAMSLEARRPIKEIIEAVAEEYKISLRAVAAGNRRKVAVDARSAVYRMAMEEGYSAAEVARYLGMSRYGVVVAEKRNYTQSAT